MLALLPCSPVPAISATLCTPWTRQNLLYLYVFTPDVRIFWLIFLISVNVIFMKSFPEIIKLKATYNMKDNDFNMS